MRAWGGGRYLPKCTVGYWQEGRVRNFDFRCVRNLKCFRCFLYKILDNVLYINQKLYTYNITDSALSSFDKTEKETTLYFFKSCTLTLLTVSIIPGTWYDTPWSVTRSYHTWLNDLLSLFKLNNYGEFWRMDDQKRIL